MAYDYKHLGIKVKSVLPGAYPTTRFNASTDDDLGKGDEQLVRHAAKLNEHLRELRSRWQIRVAVLLTLRKSLTKSLSVRRPKRQFTIRLALMR